ncbi:TauD/TfdA family dioxygenase [Streptomyces sp. NPDC048506]|uniref:TauD/TfdA family dioxygenase n=1 Tax=Streptomyces sp. NPDC048506 TaxID=3155028 RepID=UPI0034189756
MCPAHLPDPLSLDWDLTPGKPALATVRGVDDLAGARAWLTAARPGLTAALHTHGAVHLRGLPLTEVGDVAEVRDVLIPEATPYREKATPRSDFGQGVYSSTDLPASQRIHLHNENSYTLTFPGLLLFACLIAPEEGGATPVADCRTVLSLLPAHLVAKVRTAGWLLSRSYSDHISTDWQSAFGSDDRGAVERYCAQNLIAHAWQEEGSLRTGQLRPGIITHPTTGQEVWFNHLVFWNEWSLDEELRETLLDEFGRDGLPFNTAFGDGSPLTQEDLATIQAAYDAATVRERWQPGDLLLVDNILTAHGRDPFHGDRRIAVAMGAPVQLADCRPTVEPSAAFA